MKKIYCILILIGIMAGCKSIFSFARNPDKGSFTNGSIGSAGITNNPAGSKMATKNYSDTMFLKRDTMYQDFHFTN